MSSADGNRHVWTKKNDLRDVTGISNIMLKYLAPITSKFPLYSTLQMSYNVPRRGWTHIVA